MVESPNLKRSSHALCFDILKKRTFLQEELLVHFSRCNIWSYFININKQLSWNVLQYNPVFTIHIKCLSNYQLLISIIYILPPKRNTITLYSSVQC